MIVYTQLDPHKEFKSILGSFIALIQLVFVFRNGWQKPMKVNLS